MKSDLPFFKSLPYRNIILNLTEPPYPQQNNDNWSIHNMTMNDYDLFICEQGRALFTLAGKEYALSPGRALLVPPHCLVSARKISPEPVKMVAQHFMLYLFHKTDFFSHIRYRNMIAFSNWPLISTLLTEIRRIIEEGQSNWSPLDTNPLFMVILNAFIQEAYESEEFREERKSSLVLEMISLIEREYKNPLILEKLMDQSSFGYSHTANTFKEYTGLSLKAFIIERRLEAAKESLLKGRSVKESAEAAGYEDEFYFSRIFKKYSGATARDFRKRI
ncbi:AraC family transcriptional regulator [Oceanispirochaeta sp.]|jgi:YesN/AraC family two-component response regulator|uniref:helix-turn-helix transcriptional regulator n=1 Tax=Oceanispirochaeta sp. TaxID=2035350 RepID=UPI00262927E3|nr:AraC family transcriptional regulator [Oceanispirochaeta sp.]MDA3956781.1 AraC family transcriptional regulator [Oceanispirochaeta sp.]